MTICWISSFGADSDAGALFLACRANFSSGRLGVERDTGRSAAEESGSRKYFCPAGSHSLSLPNCFFVCLSLCDFTGTESLSRGRILFYLKLGSRTFAVPVRRANESIVEVERSCRWVADAVGSAALRWPMEEAVSES